MATRKSTSSRKTATAKTPAAKPKAVEAPAPSPAATAPPHVLKKRELIERVVENTGLKRRDVRTIAESVLQIMGDTVREGDSLALEPLGKLRVARVVDGPSNRTLTVKLRQKQVQASAE